MAEMLWHNGTAEEVKKVENVIELEKNEEGYERRRAVPYIIYNDGSSRSNDCWRDRNMH